MSDPGEIKGHRRTYVAARAGKFIYGLKTSQSSNPVVLIDGMFLILSKSSYSNDITLQKLTKLSAIPQRLSWWPLTPNKIAISTTITSIYLTTSLRQPNTMYLIC